MNVHHTFPVAFIALPFALACGSPHQEGSDALADGASLAVSDAEMPETPLALLETYSPRDAAALSNRMFQMGVDVAGLRVEGDDIIVEGDMVFSATHLLGESEPTIEKGYVVTVASAGERSPLVSGDRLNNIKLVMDTTLISDWINALRDAAAEWSSTGIVNISESNTGDTVTLSFARLGGCAPSPGLCTVARTDYPSGGRVGDRIRVNTEVAVTGPQVQAAARHELGHALGFTHPSEGAFVFGTERFGLYATVMHPNLANAASSVTADDLLTLQRIYAPTSLEERCAARGLVVCVATGDCVSSIEVGPFRCNDD